MKNSYRRFPEPTPWWVYLLLGIVVLVVLIAVTTAR